MKFLRSLLAVLAIGAVTISTANARDSFSLGINIGGYGNDYGHIHQHYAPPVVYHAPHAYYYEPVRTYYHAPIVSYQYYSGGGHRYNGHHARHYDRGHGWGNGHRGHNDEHRGGNRGGSRGGNHRGHR